MATDNLSLETINPADYVDPDIFNRNFNKIDPLGKAYVTDAGTNGEWYYRKWSDGRLECWLVKTFNSVAIKHAWGGWYVSSPIADIAFPFTFASIPHMTLSWATTDGNSAIAFSNSGLSTTKTGGINLGKGGSGTSTGVLSIHASGKYQ